jgi:hypothetical protein
LHLCRSGIGVVNFDVLNDFFLLCLGKHREPNIA